MDIEIPKGSRVLIVGATGFVGGRLAELLPKRGYQVRCMVRQPELLQSGALSGVEIVKGDVLSASTLAACLEGVDAAYYLVHSMAGRVDEFESLDAQAAANFTAAAKMAGLKRIIYLGGLGSDEDGLSRHLRSRQAVGAILADGGVPVTEFRAGIIVGSGSLPFEVIRYLMERLPVVPAFSCLKTKCQPIAVRDVLAYLTSALSVGKSAGRVLEIGGADTLTYEEMLKTYARVRGLRRLTFSVPCWNDGACSGCAKMLSMVAPVRAESVLPLLESLENEVVCRDRSALDIFPIKPRDFETAVRLSLRRVRRLRAGLSWTTVLFPRRTTVHSVRRTAGIICEERVVTVESSVGELFRVFSGIGGPRGWYYMDFLWSLRGWLDRSAGGPGMRRGRRHPERLQEGDILDCWTVERLVTDRLLLLRGDMRMPGRGWLQFESLPREGGGSIYRQTAYFEPRGLLGSLYWNSLYPAHKLIFAGLAQAIRRRAEETASRP